MFVKQFARKLLWKEYVSVNAVAAYGKVDSEFKGIV